MSAVRPGARAGSAQSSPKAESRDMVADLPGPTAAPGRTPIEQALARFREATKDIGEPEDEPIVEVVTAETASGDDTFRTAARELRSKVIEQAIASLSVPSIAAQHQVVIVGAMDERPAPGHPGALYEDQDSGRLYRDDGDRWVDITR